MVAVLMITYNHESFIEQAIKAVLAQKTNFPVHLYIGDDASTDNTKAVIEKTIAAFPGKVTYRRNATNLGMMKNFMQLYSLTQDKYIALCEGDDYWCDENKLQKQIDFLEANPRYAICFHRVYELNREQQLHLSPLNTSEQELTHTIMDLARKNLIHTPSVVFRNHLFEQFPSWFEKSPVGDYVLHMLNAKHGLIRYMPEPMAVYRVHDGGVWSSAKGKTAYKKWLTVLDYLLTEDFSTEVTEKLQAQRRQYAEKYLKLLMNETDWQEFLQELALYTKNDAALAALWLQQYYPAYINKLKSGRIYRVVNGLRNVVGKIRG